MQIIGSLSTRVFETRTATGSALFSLLTCPSTTTFTLLSIFSPLEMNSIKIWETIRSKNANCSLPVAVRVSKTRVLKLPIENGETKKMYGLLTKLVRSRWLDIGQVSFFVFMDRDVVEVHKHAKKKERGQYPAILTEQAWSIKDLLYGFRG